jgi:hypothetical protein
MQFIAIFVLLLALLGTRLLDEKPNRIVWEDGDGPDRP